MTTVTATFTLLKRHVVSMSRNSSVSTDTGRPGSFHSRRNIFRSKITFHVYENWGVRTNVPYVCNFQGEHFFFVFFLQKIVLFMAWCWVVQFSIMTPHLVCFGISLPLFYILTEFSYETLIFTSRNPGVQRKTFWETRAWSLSSMLRHVFKTWYVSTGTTN
jgi:hypothetical protein